MKDKQSLAELRRDVIAAAVVLFAVAVGAWLVHLML
jgi:hypothetical protein